MRCITERCQHHRGMNPNGHCHAGDQRRDVFDFCEAGGSVCWHTDKVGKQGELFEEVSDGPSDEAVSD